MQLSKLESQAYGALTRNKLDIFKIKDMCLILNISRAKAYNIVKSLKKKQIINKVGKGFFAMQGTDEFRVATTIHSPSYISFWSALNYYKYSDNMPKKIFLASPKYSKEINSFKYVRLAAKRFFGYAMNGGIIIAEKEKAIIDSLLFPKYSGGIKEIANALRAALNELDLKKLTTYALKADSKAVIRRLGFILETAECKKAVLELLHRNIGKGYELLEPGLKKKNNLNSRWLLDINYDNLGRA